MGARRTRLLLRLAAGAIAAAGIACSESPSEDQGEDAPSVYRHAMDGTPRSLDPAQAANVYAKALVVNLYDTLYRYKYLARPYELAPNLAEGMPEISADGLIYTIRLRKDARFIDDPAFPAGVGRHVTADDFVYSIKRHFDPSTRSRGAWLWQDRIVGLDDWKRDGADYDQPVSGLKAIDEHTVQIQLISPFPQLTHSLAQGFAAIVPREAVDYYGAEFPIRPVGSGPYRLERFDSSGAVLTRNPSYRRTPFDADAEGAGDARYDSLNGKAPPFMDRIEVSFIAEDAARWNTLIAGETDFIKVPVSQFDAVLESRNPPTLGPGLADRFELAANLESGFVHTDFNLSDPAIGYHPDPDQDARNRALRCAITKAYDWDRRNEVFYYGIGRVFPGILPPVVPEFDPAAPGDAMERDVDGARRLLRDAGWNADNLPDLEYGFPSNVTERQMFEQFRSFMTDIGYPAEKIRPQTFAAYGDYTRAYLNREVMLVTTSWTMDYPDAENTMQLFYGPNASPGSNSANYDNAEFNRLFRESAALLPSDERTSRYREMNRILQDDCATISGISRTLILLWNRDFIMQPDRSFVGGFFFRFVAKSDAGDGVEPE